MRDHDTILVNGVRLFSETPASPDTIIDAEPSQIPLAEPAVTLPSV